MGILHFWSFYPFFASFVALDQHFPEGDAAISPSDLTPFVSTSVHSSHAGLYIQLAGVVRFLFLLPFEFVTRRCEWTLISHI